jgi:hypothetical protein
VGSIAGAGDVIGLFDIGEDLVAAVVVAVDDPGKCSQAGQAIHSPPIIRHYWTILPELAGLSKQQGHRILLAS